MGDDDPEGWGDLQTPDSDEQEKRQIRIWKATRHWPKLVVKPAEPISLWDWLFFVLVVVAMWFVVLIILMR